MWSPAGQTVLRFWFLVFSFVGIESGFRWAQQGVLLRPLCGGFLEQVSPLAALGRDDVEGRGIRLSGVEGIGLSVEEDVGAESS